MVNANDIQLSDIYAQDWLSIRAINICGNAGLLTLTQIYNFYEIHGTFMRLKNCGKQTERELTEFCKNYKNLNCFIPEKITKNELQIIYDLNPIKRAALNRHIEYLISNLNIRAQNGINYISPTRNTKEILEKIYNSEFNFKMIANIGNKTVGELDFFKNAISNFLILLNTIPNDELNKVSAKFVIQTTFKELPANFSDEFDRMLDNSGKIKLFRFLSFLIDSDQIFKRSEKLIFATIYSQNKREYETFESIASELNISNERVRQLKTILCEDIQKYLFFLTNFITNDFVNYDIETISDLKVIDDSFAEKINHNEEVNFNALLYSIIFGLFLSKTHIIFGDNETLYEKKRTTRSKRLKSCYIINRNLFDNFSFDLFIDSINFQINDKITENYTLHFEGFLMQFISYENKQMLKEITPICETIILNEFDLVVNHDGCITFERNTKKPLHEYAFDVLENKGSMMRLDEIVLAIAEKYPEVETSEQSIRSSLQREKELFIFFGRSSTYGLKKWEVEQGGIKGGTIRNIVEEYLQHQSEPKHISEILKHVQKYRATNERSVKTNIDAEVSNRFLFFVGEYVGLKSKTYGLEIFYFKKIIGTHFLRKMLAKFNGMDLEKVIEHYVIKYGYSTIQVRYILEKKIENGYIQITTENKLKI